MPDFRCLPVRAAPLALLVALLGLPEAATAQPQTQTQTQPEPIRSFVERQLPAGAGRVEVTVGTLDPRLQLAPCARVEPYMLPGTRLWGRTAIGVRCLEGATWTVALPVTVTVRGRALVAAEPLAAGAVLPPGSLRMEDTELTREPGTPVTDPAQLVGRTLLRPMAAGQVLRMEHFRITPTVASGDPVRIQLLGQGFTIQAEGQALAAAGEGQVLRVRTDSGRILAGTLRGRTVDVRI